MIARVIPLCLFALAQPEGELVDTEEEVVWDEEEGEADQEEVVHFGEVVDREDLEDDFFMPEYDEAGWLAVLPLACVLLLIWNVRWRAGPKARKLKRWPTGEVLRRRRGRGKPASSSEPGSSAQRTP